MFHRDHRILRFRLNHFNEVGNFTRCLRGTFRQLSDLVGNDGESRTGLTGARCLDSSVEREQVSLYSKIRR